MLATQDPFEEAEKLQAQRGHWITAGVETRVFWPKRVQILEYEGIPFLLQPVERGQNATMLPAIALRTDGLGMTDEQGQAAIMRLASAIAWREGQKVELVMWGGGSSPFPMGKMRNNAVTDYLSAENLCTPPSTEARQALAFFREGLSIDNPFYSFLGFYKAFSRSLPDGRQRGPWIATALPRLTDQRAIARRDELTQEGNDISTYLFSQGRNAIAHAERDDIVDPDAPEDHFRIIKDTPLMQHLAELAMEDRLGVANPDSFYRDHLYELQGFRNLFSDGQLADLRHGQLDPAKTYEVPDHYYVLARSGSNIARLGAMRLAGAGYEEGKLLIRLEQEAGRAVFLVWLDFVNERLCIDPVQGVGLLNQDRNTRADIESELALQNFRWSVFCNASVEVWSADGAIRYGKSEDYMLPANYMPSFEDHQTYCAELKALLDQLLAP
ncbi:methylamine utilization protein MauJ [Pseudomonas sp. PDM19]|uniref:methylamine utilization protein MauJ n=1 Tax=Pseudomonas sp. PDM19 TaxID=2769272 RepID=UPI00177C44A9|nr:methylamine utilization protein MauJ [Pseudomonas sp. PDM19]MBD9631401.1 hypothetical protein [Pseudomonas sp. PDM19]